MTSAQEYRQKKNMQAKKYGGAIVCPDCLMVLDQHKDATRAYHCPRCDHWWTASGEVVPTKEKR